MKDLGFFVCFFGAILLIALSTKGGSYFGSDGAHTATATPDREFQYENANEPNSDVTPDTDELREDTAVTAEKVTELYESLNALKEEARVQKLHEPKSPFQGLVTLNQASARGTTPKDEYLTLELDSDAKNPVLISGWYLESFVTKRRVTIPQGDRTLIRWKLPNQTAITLLPGEDAYLITGSSPIATSFHENICTGYLTHERAFSPSLSESCPRPIDEMRRFGNISLTDDKCYDYVDNIPECSAVKQSVLKEASLSRACKTFIEETLSYEGCTRAHSSDLDYNTDGSWYIFFRKVTEQWRDEREIIRLMDAEGRIVDVLEY